MPAIFVRLTVFHRNSFFKAKIVIFMNEGVKKVKKKTPYTVFTIKSIKRENRNRISLRWIHNQKIIINNQTKMQSKTNVLFFFFAKIIGGKRNEVKKKSPTLLLKWIWSYFFSLFFNKIPWMICMNKINR